MVERRFSEFDKFRRQVQSEAAKPPEFKVKKTTWLAKMDNKVYIIMYA